MGATEREEKWDHVGKAIIFYISLEGIVFGGILKRDISIILYGKILLINFFVGLLDMTDMIQVRVVIQNGLVRDAINI